MRPVKQTKLGGPDAAPEDRGDCFDACLASVLELPITETTISWDGDWWEESQRTLARHGYRMLHLSDQDTPVSTIAEWLGPIYWIASVPSLNLGSNKDGSPVMHVIVMRGNEVVHDPSLRRCRPLGPADDLSVRNTIVLVELEPRGRR